MLKAAATSTSTTRLEEEIQRLKKENETLRAQIGGVGADRAAAVKKGIESFQALLDGGLITQTEFEERREELLDKLVDAHDLDDVLDATLRAPEGTGFLSEEVKLGGRVLYLSISRQLLVKYPFGKPYCKPLLNVLFESAQEAQQAHDQAAATAKKAVTATPSSDSSTKSKSDAEFVPTALHFIEVANENLSRLLGFCRHFFVIVDRESMELLNVWRYDQMKRWIFQTFLTVDLGRYQSNYLMFRMEINKARSIQKLLLKYIELAELELQEDGEGDDDEDAGDALQPTGAGVTPKPEADNSWAGWLSGFWD